MAGIQETEEFKTMDYGDQLLKRLKEFHEEQLLCDFTLKVDHEVFKVHRAVLAGCSDYFRAMFSHNMMDRKRNHLDLRNMSVSGVRAMVNYAYNGRLNLSLDNVADILAVATFLQITAAIQLCVDFLKCKTTFDNAEDLLVIGDSFGLTDLRKHHNELILANFLDFSETEAFLKMDGKRLAKYLESDSLRTSTEGTLLKCALTWYNHDRAGREADIADVLERIRYTIDGWPTIEYACGIEPFTTNAKCRDIIHECHKYMQHASRKHLNQSHRTRVRYDRKTVVQFGGVIQSGYQRDVWSLAYGSRLDQLEVHGCPHNQFYHLDLHTWFPTGVVGLSDSRSHCSFVEVNDFGILIGGYLYYSPSDDPQKYTTNEVKLFTPGGFALWDMKYMNIERAQHAAVAIQGYIFAIGGRNDYGDIMSVEEFHLEREVWRYVRSLDRPVYDLAGTALNNRVYISGGIEEEHISNRVRCYNQDRDVWEERAPMLACRAGHAMTTLDGKIVVCGGHTTMETTRCLASVEVYSLEHNQWTYISPMRHDCCAMSPVVLENKLLLVGGENSVGELQSLIQEYDPVTKKWGIFGCLPQAVKNSGCCALTIKLTRDGTEDKDSLAEAFDNMFLDESEDEWAFADADGEDWYPEHGAYFPYDSESI